MLQAPPPPTVVERPVTVVQPPPRVVEIRPKVIVKPRDTIVVHRPPVVVYQGRKRYFHHSCSNYNCEGPRTTFRLPDEVPYAYYEQQYAPRYGNSSNYDYVPDADDGGTP